MIGDVDDDFYEKLDEELDKINLKRKRKVKLNLATKFSVKVCEKIFKSKDFKLNEVT